MLIGITQNAAQAFFCRLTDFTGGTHKPRYTVAREAVGLVDAGAAMVTGVGLALIDVDLTLVP